MLGKHNYEAGKQSNLASGQMVDTLQQHPRISVVTPSFNQSDFLEATLKSVIDQRYADLEYVVIDGGSTDHSVSIIESYEAMLAYWVSEPDQGHAHALNKGFSRTTGDLMCWINSSDLYYPWTFQIVAEIFTQFPGVEWIMGAISMVDVRGRPRVVAAQRGTNVYDVLAGRYRYCVQQESVFWRRSLWERSGGYLDQRLTYAADLDLWLRFFRLAPLYRVGTLLGGFRVHEDSLGKAGDDLYGREAAEVYSRFVSSQDRTSLSRGRLIRMMGAGRHKMISDGLNRMGLLPWYRHPQIEFNFDRMAWVLS